MMNMMKLMACVLVSLALALPSDAQVLSPPRKAPAATKPVAAKPVVKKSIARKRVAKKAITKRPVARKPVRNTAAGANTGANQPVAKQLDPSPLPAQKPGSTLGAAVSNNPASPSVRSWRPYRFALFSSEIVDTNIERDQIAPVSANGFVVGAAVRYQSTELRPALTATYEIARHSYTRSAQFDRVSHNLSAVAYRRFTKRLSGEAIAEAAVKGSSEDRDVGNQYLFLPRLNYRMTDAQRLRLYGAYRMRRYDVNEDRNAENRYAGAEFRTDVSDDARLEVGFRYETNSARAARRSYVRRTYHTQYTRALSDRDDISAELKYRSQRYDQRLVKEDGDNPRQDHRVTPALEWIHRFGRGVSMIAFYDFENRWSNDPDKGYRDHRFALTGRIDW